MNNVFDVLTERGYIEQSTDIEAVKELLGKEKISFYIGFDPTADSLHVGHFIQIMVIMHMQRAGHRPIILLGGGTGMIGDPSGRTDMRKFLSTDGVNHNVNRFKAQMSKFVDFSDDKAIMVDNGEWLLNLNYIDFIRDIGKHFSVNRMLTAECFKSRMENGLSFLEFNYMLLQAYDFLQLNQRYNCKLELGGSDQWSNIIAGVDLVRREAQNEVYGLTFKLLTNSAGKKMGKTEAGALWLDREKTTPYEFYQYWRNIDDADVEKCLSLLTFLPMDEVRRLSSLEGAEINKAKEVLAFEVTKLVHSEEDAIAAQNAARALFAGGNDFSDAPATDITEAEIGEGMDILSVLDYIKLVPSKSEGRRVIKDGGLYVNNQRVEGIDRMITLADFEDGKVLIRKGKKSYHQLILK